MQEIWCATLVLYYKCSHLRFSFKLQSSAAPPSEKRGDTGLIEPPYMSCTSNLLAINAKILLIIRRLSKRVGLLKPNLAQFNFGVRVDIIH